MRLIKPSHEIIEQEPGLLGVCKQIEKAARVSYKSENRITEDSWKSLLDNLLKNKHYSPFEFGTIYLTIQIDSPMYDWGYIKKIQIVKFYQNNKYSWVNHKSVGTMQYYYITTNARVLIENDRVDDVCYFVEPTTHHEKRACVKFILSRGTSHEYVRHRCMSFIQESTRYCNYSSDKFSNEVTYIIPNWTDLKPGYYRGWPNNSALIDPFLSSLQTCETAYFELLKQGWKPQHAREVLPNALKTELWMCGFVEDWYHFFELRCSSSAHPSARELAIPLEEDFKNARV